MLVDSQAARTRAAGEPASRLRICLAASGGGHVRQLLDLKPVWQGRDYFFVTEDTALGRTIGDEHRTYFLPHFAWGQAKHGAVLKMLGRAFLSLVRSAQLVLRERPDVVITTGAGAVYPTVLLARLFGAKVIGIESFARFEHPSLFGRMTRPIAHHFMVQSPKMARWYPNAEVFDPLRVLDSVAPPKDDLTFVTVGATLPFDRMVAAAAELERQGDLTGRVVVQTGIGGAKTQGAEVYETLPFDQVQALLDKASVVVCHGGTGSIITALRAGCHVIAMPRRPELGEHYDNHQAEITEAFERRGLVLVADTADELRQALARCKDRPRVMATTDPAALIARLEGLLTAWERGLATEGVA